MLRSSWAVDDAIDPEEARVSLAALLMPGLRDPSAGYPDLPIGRGGLRPGYATGTPPVPPGTVTFTGASTVTVQPFQLFLPATRASTAGGVYVITSDEPENFEAFDTPHPTYDRFDMLIVEQHDPFYGDGDSDAVIRYVPGPVSSSPAFAALTGDYYVLKRWLVPHGITSLASALPIVGMPQDTDRYSVAVGGILPATAVGRDAMTARGWAGLTIYNMDSQSLEVLSGPGGTWKRQLDGSPVLRFPTVSPTSVPVRIDGTLYLIDNDVYIYLAPGTLTRLTYTNVTDSNWKILTLASELRPYGGDIPAARQIGPYTAQLQGAVYRYGSVSHGPAFVYGDLLARLPVGLRPVRNHRLACPTEISQNGGDASTGKVTLEATTGQIYYYCPAAHKATWIGFDGITYSLDNYPASGPSSMIPPLGTFTPLPPT
jgi:hypothetical protein